MRSVRTLEELRHVIGDVLNIAAFSDAQMVQALLKKVNGNATMRQLLQATLAVARQRENQRIEELESKLADAESDRDELETTLRDIRDKLAEHEQTEGRTR